MINGEYELALKTRVLLDKDVLPNIANMACDIGRINEIGMLCNEVIKLHDDKNGDILYLLYDGDSPDGRGSAKYIGRTNDKEKALKHYESCKSPYSTGYVDIITDTKNVRMCWENV